MSAGIYVSVGSNIDPEENIPRGIALLKARVKILRASTFYRTPALDRPDQGDFLNGVLEIETVLLPRELRFEVLREVEARAGRRRGADKYAPRELDLDILLYGGFVVDEDDLRIPDPDIRQRPFLAAPLVELVPDLRLPDSGERLAGLDVARRPLDADRVFTARLRARISDEQTAH